MLKEFKKSFVGRNWKYLLIWIILNVVAVVVVGIIMNYYCMNNVITK
jgi:hypothetical protein